MPMHTITQGEDIRTVLPWGVSVQDWLWNAVNGSVESYGKVLLSL